MSVNCSNL